jgi:hypothetical protein
MVTVLVPVRYPLSDHSRSTLRTALDVAEERGAELVVLHVDLYHEGADVTRSKLKAEVEREFDSCRTRGTASFGAFSSRGRPSRRWPPRRRTSS